MNKKGVKFATLKWWWSSLGPQGLQRQIDTLKALGLIMRALNSV